MVLFDLIAVVRDQIGAFFDVAEAFDPVWYWSSTQHAGDAAYAWCQVFSDGYQVSSLKDGVLRVVLVRRVAI